MLIYGSFGSWWEHKFLKSKLKLKIRLNLVCKQHLSVKVMEL